MPFGQQSGPPASAKDVKELLRLLQELGHSDFRDARGPMGLTQRQAAGKFSRDEAAALIERLHEGEGEPNSPVPGPPAAVAGAAAGAGERGAGERGAGERGAGEQVLRRMPAEQLAAELTRRGWRVSAP